MVDSDDGLNQTTAVSVPQSATISFPGARPLNVNGERPRWTRLCNVDANWSTPCCTLQKMLSFAFIMHPRLGNQRFGKYREAEKGFHGNAMPVDVARLILTYAVGTITSSVLMRDKWRSNKSLVLLSKGLQLCGRLGHRSHRLQANFRRVEYWNVPFVVAAASCDKRFLSNTGLAPDLGWLAKFMTLEGMNLPMVSAVPRRFYKKITGTRANTDFLRPAFAGCKSAALVLNTAKQVTYERHWLERIKMQTWWDAHGDLFQHSQRFHLDRETSKAGSNFILFSVRNPETVAVNGAPTEMHRPVTAALVSRWLEDLWGPWNVQTFVRVRDMASGVQIFVCGPHILPLIDDILQADSFRKFGHIYAKQTYVPL